MYSEGMIGRQLVGEDLDETPMGTFKGCVEKSPYVLDDINTMPVQ